MKTMSLMLGMGLAALMLSGCVYDPDDYYYRDGYYRDGYNRGYYRHYDCSYYGNCWRDRDDYYR